MLKRSRSSEMWSHFTALNSDYAKCNLCGKQLSHKTSISNLKKHLEKAHVAAYYAMTSSRAVEPVVPEQVEAPSAEQLPADGTTACSNMEIAVPSTSQQRITDYVPRKMGSGQKKKIDRQLMALFVKDYQPFSVVNDFGFRGFVHALNPSYEIPSRRAITNVMLPAIYVEVMNKVQQKLEGVKTISLTTDCWTSAANESYMAVTGHFITQDFKLESVLLECSQLSGPHSSENLSNNLRTIMEKYRLNSKLLMVTTDNAANIKNAVTSLGWKQFGCYAHTLNLIVQHALQNCQDVHQKVKAIVAFFKRSSTATERLLTYQKNNNSDSVKKLIQDMPTRWNSTLYMIKRMVELSEAVKSTVGFCNSALQPLSDEEWTICSELCSVLKPFEEVTTQLSAETYPTGSLMIVLTHGLLTVCNEICKGSLHAVTKKVVEDLRKGLCDRFHNIEHSKSIALPTLLDPRFKLLAFQDAGAADTMKKELIHLVARKNGESRPQIIQTHEETVATNVETESLSVWGAFQKKVKTAQPPGTAMSSAIAEVQRYIEDPVIATNEDPLAWWRVNQYMFPSISKVVKDKFNIVATSVPCERIFSKAGLLINDRRTRLKAANIEKLIFLNANGID